MKAGFNIHNLLSFEVEGSKRYLDYFSREYSYFKTDEKLAPDISVIVSSISPAGDCRLVDNKYSVKDGYLYCRDSYKVARWGLSVDGLEGKTVLRFIGGMWGEHILNDFIFVPLIGLKLAGKGFSILHASSIAVSGKAIAFAGAPGAGKTAAVLSLNSPDSVFMSDEITILKDGVVYSFPSPLRLYYYNSFITHRTTLQQRLEMRTKHFIYLLSLGYAKLPLSISAGRLFHRIGGVYPLRCLVLLTGTKDGSMNVTEITDKKGLAERLALVNERQFPYWSKYMRAYLSANPSSQLASYSKVAVENLSHALDGVGCYAINIPHGFKDRDEFRNVIKPLGKA